MYQALINEGIRAQLLRTLLEQQEAEDEELSDEDETMQDGTEGQKDETGEGKEDVEAAEEAPKSSAAHLQTYLQSKLVFAGEGDQEVCLDACVF